MPNPCPDACSFTAFDTEEESARAFAILTEEDPFRLVIRGHAMVEDMLDRAINAAFCDGTPRELAKLRLGARVALAEALERPIADRPLRDLASNGLHARLRV